MTPDELRDIMSWLRERVHLKEGTPDDDIAIVFQTPTADELDTTTLNRDGIEKLLGSEWWSEMVEDIVETPEMCDPDDPSEQVLDYAKDVVSEYIRKRASL